MRVLNRIGYHAVIWIVGLTAKVRCFRRPSLYSQSTLTGCTFWDGHGLGALSPEDHILEIIGAAHLKRYMTAHLLENIITLFLFREGKIKVLVSLAYRPATVRWTRSGYVGENRVRATLLYLQSRLPSKMAICSLQFTGTGWTQKVRFHQWDHQKSLQQWTPRLQRLCYLEKRHRLCLHKRLHL